MKKIAIWPVISIFNPAGEETIDSATKNSNIDLCENLNFPSLKRFSNDLPVR
jgi:hypothetical protein